MKEYIHPAPWFGDERVHFSHQALLLRKNPGFYGRYSWPILPTYPVLEADSFVYHGTYWNRKRGQTKTFDFNVFSSA
jgi:hypothetical protein